MMNVLVLGKGGREHAIARALAGSPSVEQVFALPGRRSFAPQALCLPGALLDKALPQPDTASHSNLKALIKEKNIKLVVIGPEKELTEGWADFFCDLSVPVFGPSREATQLESSKLFAKRFMARSNVPTSDFEEVSSVEQVLSTAPRFGFPVVLKADGLAGGKGVFICQDKAELEQSARAMFEQKIFGPAGEKALLERFQKGEELSVFVLTNGSEYRILPFARDYKKLKENNQGPNTGGMGAFAPHVVSPALKKHIEESIVRPSIEGIKSHNLFYRGVLYIGLMIVDEQALVLEYNVRFGDPEAQVLFPLLKGDWAEALLSTAKGVLPDLSWKENGCSACVVLASKGYPLQPVTGALIKGEPSFESPYSYFLHAGTKKTDEGFFTDGGRVLNAIGLGETKEIALQHAYEQASRVQWPGMQKRSDIGSKI